MRANAMVSMHRSTQHEGHFDALDSIRPAYNDNANNMAEINTVNITSNNNNKRSVTVNNHHLINNIANNS